jgi:hypothetical protein
MPSFGVSPHSIEASAFAHQWTLNQVQDDAVNWEGAVAGRVLRRSLVRSDRGSRLVHRRGAGALLII